MKYTILFLFCSIRYIVHALTIHTSLPIGTSSVSSLSQEPFPTIQFVLALDYDSITGYKENHGAACTRHGLYATENTFTLFTLNNINNNTIIPLYWDNSTITQALSTIPNVTVSTSIVNGCCSPSIWCTKLLNNQYECSTHSIGGTSYTNYGWTVDTNMVPVFSCINLGVSLQQIANIIPVVGATQLVYNLEWYPKWRLRIDGIKLSNNGNTNDPKYAQNNPPSVQIGDVKCKDVDVCQDMCKMCIVDADCGIGKNCMYFSSEDSSGYCLRPCNSDRTCPCGGRCYRVTIDRYGNFIRLCANPNILSQSDVCQNFAWGPSILTGMTDRIECTPISTNTARRMLLDNPSITILEGESNIDKLIISNDNTNNNDILLDATSTANRNPSSKSFSLSSSSSTSVSRESSDTSSSLSNTHTSTTLRNSATQHLNRRSLPTTTTVTGNGIPKGADRYSVLCAGGGAVGAGLPGIYPIIVERDQGWASTGLGRDLANSSGIYPTVFNITTPNSTAVVSNTSKAFISLPYIGYTFPYMQSYYSCVNDAQCPLIDICTVPRCVVGAIPAGRTTGGSCCIYVPSGRCNTTDNPLSPGEGPTHSSYIALDATIANILPLPPPPRGGLDERIIDPLIRNPTAQPRAITWDPAALWYNVSSPAGKATFQLSPGTSTAITYSLNGASEVDDVPMYPVTLNWVFPYFGAKVRTLWVSGNGYLRVVDTVPCGGSYSYEGCSFVNDYAGVIGPLISDYYPGSYVASEVWTAVFDASPYYNSSYGAPSSANIFCTVFSEMGLFRTQKLPPSIPPDPSFTFSLCLYGDGGIRWRYGRLLGLPTPATGSWNETTQLPIDGGGPPNTTSWIAGVRSLSAASPQASDDETKLLNEYNRQYSPDIAVETTSELLLSRGGVRPGGNIALCNFHPVACVNNACGTVNTSVKLSWGGIGCGIGFETLLADWVIKMKSLNAYPSTQFSSSPRLECVFGSVRVPVDWITVPHPTNNATNRTVIECIAPYVPELAGSMASKATVPLSLQIVLPTISNAYTTRNGSVVQATPIGVSNGIGPSPYTSSSTVEPVTGNIITPLDIYGMLAVTYGNASVLVNHVLVPHVLQFTYILDGSNATCGCDTLSSSAMCDSCSVCGGDGSSRDCAGVCFGSAFIDNCGICSGGTTFHVADSDKDCKGICFGPDKNCGPTYPSDANVINESSLLLTTVIVIALFTCLFSLFTVLAYFGWIAILRQRAVEQMIEHLAMGDATALGLPPGLTNAQRNRMPVIIYDPKDEVFKANAPGGGETCSICMEDFKEADHIRKLPPCGHIFHLHCVDTWLVRSTVCPVCRAELRSPEEVAANLEQRRRRAHELRNVMTTPGQLQQIQQQQQQQLQMQLQQQQQQQQQQQGAYIPQEVDPQYAFHPGVTPATLSNNNYMNTMPSSTSTESNLPREAIEIEMTAVHTNNDDNSTVDGSMSGMNQSNGTIPRSISRSRLAGLTPAPPTSQRRRGYPITTISSGPSALAAAFSSHGSTGIVAPLNDEMNNAEVSFVNNATYGHNANTNRNISVLPTAYNTLNTNETANLTIRNVNSTNSNNNNTENSNRSAYPAVPMNNWTN